MKAYERTFLAKWRLVLVYWSVRNHKTVELTDEILDLENFLEMMDESLSIFSPAVIISSVGCSHLSVIIQTVMTLLFVFDLHAQTNNYINLYKLTKWTVISNCSLVTDPETQIQLKFTVSWQPSDTYDCISTKIHFFQGKRWASQHIYGVQVFGQMFVPPLKRKTKHFYVAICNQSLQFIEFPSSLWRTAGVKS